MLNKIFDWFRSQKELRVEIQKLKLAVAYERLERERVERTLEKQSHTLEAIPVVGFDSLDTEPADSEQRRGYVNTMVEAYRVGVKDKLKITVAETRKLLSNMSTEPGVPDSVTRSEYDYFVRGMEAMAIKMNGWFALLESEQASRLQNKE